MILTQKGLELKSEMEAHRREEEMRIRRALSEDEARKLYELLGKVLVSLE